MNLALVSIGIGLFVTSCLITSAVLWVAAHPGDLFDEYKKWPVKVPWNPVPVKPGGFARTMSIISRSLLAATGLALATIGLIPEDFIPDLHRNVVVVRGFGMCLWLASMGVLWFKRTYWVIAFILFTVIAGAGGIAMLTTSESIQIRGLFERAMIYPFIIGLAIVGFMIAVGAHNERNRRMRPRPKRPWR
ncbi:ABC-type sugar transport system permease subunit [Arthrobacter sp. AZCC_0090]|nr:ABC-type sugar transport system permease subunit [Arthrobacter sp. AZCC_0090]